MFIGRPVLSHVCAFVGVTLETLCRHRLWSVLCGDSPMDSPDTVITVYQRRDIERELRVETERVRERSSSSLFALGTRTMIIISVPGLSFLNRGFLIYIIERDHAHTTGSTARRTTALTDDALDARRPLEPGQLARFGRSLHLRCGAGERRAPSTYTSPVQHTTHDSRQHTREKNAHERHATCTLVSRLTLMISHDVSHV